MMKKVAIFNDTSGSGHFGCIAVMSNLRALLIKNYMNPIYFWPAEFDWRPYREQIINDLNDIDAVIINGEGTIHNDKIKSGARALLELGKFCKQELKKPCFLINATLYNISEKGMYFLSQFEKIFVRDSSSENLLKMKNIVTSRTFDLSLIGSIKENDRIVTNRNVPYFSKIHFTGSVLPVTHSELKNLSVRFKGTFEDIMPPMKLSEKIYNRFQGVLKHIPYKRARKALRYVNQHQRWLNKMYRTDLVVSGRFHGATLSIRTFTPFIALESNTPKVSSFLKDVFNNTNRLLSIPDISEFLANSKNLKFTEKEIKNINDYLYEGEHACKKMMNDIHQGF